MRTDPASGTATAFGEPAPETGRALVCLVLGAGALILAVLGPAAAGLPPLSHHMVIHILLVGLVGRLAAEVVVSLRRELPSMLSGARVLVAAAGFQIALLWAMHAPSVMASGAHRSVTLIALQAVLLAVACVFWLSVIGQRPEQRWRAMIALLLTGKLLCLLGILLVFAPRAIYPAAHGQPIGASLADQQLAGLLMIVGCPLTYVVGAVVIAARWLGDIERRDESPSIAIRSG